MPHTLETSRIITIATIKIMLYSFLLPIIVPLRHFTRSAGWISVSTGLASALGFVPAGRGSVSRTTNACLTARIALGAVAWSSAQRLAVLMSQGLNSKQRRTGDKTASRVSERMRWSMLEVR